MLFDQQKRAPTPAMLRIAVGCAALIFPALHSLSDLLEWSRGGFTLGQLWLTYVAFVPMPWLLLGIYAVHPVKPHGMGLVGALLYGAAFTYFIHSALYAIAENSPNYEALWAHLGVVYTVHGAMMICGGLLIAWALYAANWLPRSTVLLFVCGVMINLIIALVPVPDLMQTIGTAVRNLGIMTMGFAILVRIKT